MAPPNEWPAPTSRNPSIRRVSSDPVRNPSLRPTTAWCAAAARTGSVRDSRPPDDCCHPAEVLAGLQRFLQMPGEGQA
jgi:hypothetical protein